MSQNLLYIGYDLLTLFYTLVVSKNTSLFLNPLSPHLLLLNLFHTVYCMQANNAQLYIVFSVCKTVLKFH